MKAIALLLGAVCLLGGCSPRATVPLAQSAPSFSSEAPIPVNPQPEEADVTENSYDWFSTPEMTPEQQRYYDTYINPLVYNGLLFASWSSEDYANISTAPSGASQSQSLMMAFEDLVGQEKMEKLWEIHGGDLPAETVESVLLERFPFTREQLHEILHACYRPQTNTYVYEGGRGGGPIEAAVVYLEEEGAFLHLDYVLFTGYSGLDREPALYLYQTPGRLTLKKQGEPYLYWAVEVGQEIEAAAKGDVAVQDR